MVIETHEVAAPNIVTGMRIDLGNGVYSRVVGFQAYENGNVRLALRHEDNEPESYLMSPTERFDVVTD